MATYDKCIYDIPAYQEGNESDFEFDFDETFPINQIIDITFLVKNAKCDVLISDRKVGGTITLTDRTVRIPLLPATTKNHIGNHLYEIDLINASGNPFATIGGKFIVDKEVNDL